MGFLANIGLPGVILIVFLALLVFGPKKLPEMGKAVGDTLKEFKKTTKEISTDVADVTSEVTEVAEEVKKG